MMEDKEGIERGKCLDCEECQEFVSVEKGYECDFCNCPGARHEKISGLEENLESRCTSKSLPRMTRKTTRGRNPVHHNIFHRRTMTRGLSLHFDSRGDLQDENSIPEGRLATNSRSSSIGSPVVLAFNSKIVYASDITKNVAGWVQGQREPTPTELGDFVKLDNTYKYVERWFQPFFWDPSEKIDLQDFYVPLPLDVYNGNGQKKKGLQVELEQLFDPVFEGGDRAKRVLIIGDWGEGKTAICSYISLSWAHGTTVIRALPHESTLVVFYHLRDFVGDDLESDLLEFVNSNYTSKSGSKNSIQEVRHILQELGPNVIVILDGYNETESKEKVRHLVSGHEGNVFYKCTFLVTSRPTEDRVLLELFDKQFYISKTTDERAMQLVQKSLGNSTSDIDRFCSMFDVQVLEELTAFTIFTLCWIFKQRKSQHPESYCDIMIQCINILTKQCNTMYRYGFSEARIEKILCRLGIVGALLQIPVVKAEELSLIFQDDCSFVTKMGILKYNGGGEYKPVHKIFFESLTQNFFRSPQTYLDICLSEKEMDTLIEYYLRPLIDRTDLLSITIDDYKSQPTVIIDLHPVYNSRQKNKLPSNLQEIHLLKQGSQFKVFKEYRGVEVSYACVIYLHSFDQSFLYSIAKKITNKLEDWYLTFKLLCESLRYLEIGENKEDGIESFSLAISFSDEQDPRVKIFALAIVQGLLSVRYRSNLDGHLPARTTVVIKSPGNRVGRTFVSAIKELFEPSRDLFRRDFSLYQHRCGENELNYFEGWKTKVHNDTVAKEFSTLGLMIFHIEWINYLNPSPTILMASTSFPTRTLNRKDKEHTTNSWCNPGITYMTLENWPNLIETYQNIYDAWFTYPVEQITFWNATQTEEELSVIFDCAREGGRRAETVLLTDETNLDPWICKHVASRWAHGMSAIWSLPCWSFLPVLIDMESLDGTVDLRTELIRLVHTFYNPEGRYHESGVEEHLEILAVNHLVYLGGRVLFLLDGFDKAERGIREQVKQLLKSKREGYSQEFSPFHLASFLVTSRVTTDAELSPSLFEKHYFLRMNEVEQEVKNRKEVIKLESL